MINNFLIKINHILRNDVLRFVFFGYAVYFVQFINSIFIAIFLGPYYLGIWGFLSLVLQYINQFNFGISHSINALVSVNKDKTVYVTKLLGSATTLLIFLSIILIILYSIDLVFNLNFGEKYRFSEYSVYVLIIAIVGYFNSLISNIFRVYGKLTEIAISQIAFPFLLSISLFFFKGEDLLWALVFCNLLSFIIIFVLFILKSPIKIRLDFNLQLSKIILHKGWYLFVYNTSFYLIIITTRSFVSNYYTVSEFGYFTFSFTLANALLLLLESISYIVYPKILNRFAIFSKEEISLLLAKVRDAYITTSHALTHIAILLFPIFILFFPKYENTVTSFNIIALTVVLYSNSFGYSGLLVAKNFEKPLGLIAFVALSLNVLFSFVLIKYLNVPYSFVMISTMITYLLYVVAIGAFGRKIIGLNLNILVTLKDVFPIRLLIPYILSLLISLNYINPFYFIIPIFLFIILNFNAFKNILDVIKNIIVNPNYVKL